MSNAKSRRWCFTINNPESDDLFVALPAGVRYVIWQRERGAEGTEHLQGYVVFSNARALVGVKKLLGERAHCEISRGSDEQCVAYCSKEDTRVRGPFSFGERMSGQGKRTDIDEAAEEVLKTGSIQNVKPALIVKYAKGLTALSLMVPAPHRAKVDVICLTGTTGIGKTWNVFDRYPDVYRPLIGNSGLWWDGYDGEDAVLFDEFEGQVQITKMLQYLDPYKLKLEVKGGSVWAKYTKVFITSNRTPEEWYPGVKANKPAQFNALARRVGLGTPTCFWATTRANCAARFDIACDYLWQPAPVAVAPVMPVFPVNDEPVDDEDWGARGPPPSPPPSGSMPGSPVHKASCIVISDDEEDEE